MQELIEVIGSVLGLIYGGFLIGSHKRQCKLWKLCKEQQHRGDHWFERYIQEVKDNQEPLTKDF